MKHHALIVAAICAASLASCSGDKNFRISGEISGNPTMNIYVKYYANGAVQTSVAAVREGIFELEGNAPDPAMLEILDNEYNVLGRAYVKNGDKLKLTLDRRNPYRITAEGNEVNSRWADAVSTDADSLYIGSTEFVNAFVERYAQAHPDDVVSTLLYLSCYDASVDPLRADSVLGSIDAEVRPGSLTGTWTLMSRRCSMPEVYERVDTIKYRVAKNDSALVYHPADAALSLLVFGDEASQRADSVVPRLKEIKKAFPKKERLDVVEFVMLSDTVAYKRAVARDSASWTQAWVPGGVFASGIDRLALPSVPYYIVVDSTGRQLYRGASPEKARSIIDKRLSE